jgi:phosphoribosylaminoimidazole-succinocarboxamide synthase
MDLTPLYEGKAKIIYKTEDDNQLIQYFKDSATAFNNVKKDTIVGKGILNNFISEFIMQRLSDGGVKNHFIKRLDDRQQLIKKLNIIPLEVIVRNVAAGSFSKRLAVKEGTILKKPLIEFCLKDDELGDPLITEDHIDILEIATFEEIALIKDTTAKINQILIKIFDAINITLVDFKIEFGRDSAGNIMLADEISPDSCRLWDKTSKEKMDKDRFRLDLGNLVDYYLEVANRLKINIPKLTKNA